MRSKATTVAEYLAGLPEDRRAAIEDVRQMIRENLNPDYEEGMQYGMIGYYVPHRVYPAGYHCDPKQPLPFAALASQKQYMSLYLMSVYCGCGSDDAASKHAQWFRDQWAKTGKKMDMGKACIRFKKLEDLPLELIGKAVKRVPAKKYIQYVEAARAARAGGKAKKARA
jgi:uncharacterized protein YdhG (YjbR/CyaY superfamily)